MFSPFLECYGYEGAVGSVMVLSEAFTKSFVIAPAAVTLEVRDGLELKPE